MTLRIPPSGGAARQPFDVVNVRAHGATGLGQVDDAAAINDAIAAAKASIYWGNVGAVYIPPGLYLCQDEVVALNSMGQTISVYGAGKNVTTLQFTEQGPGSCAIRQENPIPGGASQFQIRDLTLIGPGQNLGLGVSSTEMDGVELPPGGRAYGIKSAGFWSGIVGYNDHWQIHDCQSKSNQYGVYFKSPPGGAGSGNQVIRDSNLSGNHLASIGIGPRQNMGAVTLQDNHYGFGPFVVYAEDATGDPQGSNNFMSSCTWITSGIESIGNGLFFDEGRSRGITNNVFVDFGISGVPDTNLRSLIHPHDYGIVCGSISGNRTIGYSHAFHAYMDLGAIDCDAMTGNEWEKIDIAALDLMFQGAQRWVKSSVAMSTAAGESNRFQSPTSEGYLAKTSAAVAKNRLLERVAAGLVREFQAGGSGIVAGVSAAAGASGDIIPVIDAGLAKLVHDADLFDSTPAWVKPSTSVNGQVTTVGATESTVPRIGWTRAAAIGGNPTLTQLALR